MKKIIFSVMALGLVMYSAVSIAQNVVVEEPEEVLAALEIKETDHVAGDMNAPITIVEYASMTCGHCADFHTKYYEEVKEKLVETGRVKFVFRPLPWDNRALAVSMVAECAPKEDYSTYISAFFNTHETWVRSAEFMDSIKQIARLGGMSAGDVDACIKNPDVNDIVRKGRAEAIDVVKVTGTPTFFINGHRFSGVITAGEIIDYVTQLEEKAKK